jgi:uncharacterized membrane protein YhaH (DUF805 family)
LKFLKPLFSFEGRVNRVRYWGTAALACLLAAVFAGIALLIAHLSYSPASPFEIPMPEAAIAVLVLAIGLIIMVSTFASIGCIFFCALSLATRRLRDMGVRGEWSAAVLIAPSVILVGQNYTTTTVAGGDVGTSHFPLGIIVTGAALFVLGCLPGRRETTPGEALSVT